MRRYICLLLFYLFTFLPLYSQQHNASPLRKLQLAEMAITNFYVDSVDEQKLAEDAIRGMLEKLDPHSTYTDAKETKAMNEPLQGDFEGIGVQFNMINDTLVVIQPVVNGPSEKVGILAGDRIVNVNDSSIAGVKMARIDIMKRLRGRKGTKVKLGIVLCRHTRQDSRTYPQCRLYDPAGRGLCPPGKFRHEDARRVHVGSRLTEEKRHEDAAPRPSGQRRRLSPVCRADRQ